MKKRRCSIDPAQRDKMRQNVANLATIVAAHKARQTILEKVARAEQRAEKAITGGDLDSGGKLNPAKFPNSGLAELTEGDDPVPPAAPPKKKKAKKADEEVTQTVKLFVPVLKANAEEKTVTGVVLQPEIVDAQGDVISAEVIKKAAERFLSSFNRSTKLGLQHKNFSKKFELLQSFIAPTDFVLNSTTVRAGSWVMKVRVVDAGVWKLVKDGKIKGFSIGGKAKVVQLKAA